VWTIHNFHGLDQQRRCTTSYAASIASIVYLRTDMLNIWSHLLDKVVWMDMGLPDMSHHVMHVLVVARAWMYAQEILSRYHEGGRFDKLVHIHM
jgi:hypothetical protein